MTMMRFDLSKYSTVAERLAQFHTDYPEGRIVTSWENSDPIADPTKPQIWVVKAEVFLTADDQRNYTPKASGLAFERDGTGGANNTSALENAETSAIGRALMVAGYSMNKEPNSLASREEMEKVIRTERNWVTEADNLEDVEALRLLWSEAKAAAAPKAVLDKVAARAKSVDTRSVDK
jgi:hypothetical protein